MTIWERYETDQRGQVWVAEGIRPDLDPASATEQLEIIDACLDAIEASREFLLLDTGEYGSFLHFLDQTCGSLRSTCCGKNRLAAIANITKQSND
ncbi:hypothetical protein [Yoonia sp. F2084L]|uniref:hypothetical protein n=1 Tax=Yoonia sp. F2084L TaxID=2926419 RepID=UPI001FF319CF|nr:hypothetical protein [Yoonia sp. F2084L]